MGRKLLAVGALLLIVAAVGVYLLVSDGSSPPETPGRAAQASPTPEPTRTPPASAKPPAARPGAPVPPASEPPAVEPRRGEAPKGRVVSGEDARPIPHARLVLWPGSPAEWWRTPPAKPLAEFTADDQGRFTVPPLKDAESLEATLVVSAAGWGTHFKEVWGFFSVVEVTIELNPGRTIQGCVTDEDDRPVASARVFVASAEDEIESLYRRGSPVPSPFLSTATGGDGRYRIDDVALDGYPSVFAVDGDGFLGLARLRDLSYEGRVVERGIRIERRGTLAMHLHDPSGRPVVVGRCRLLRREDDVWADRTPFNASSEEPGRIRYENLLVGRYTVLLWPQGWRPERREVEIRAGMESKLDVTGRPGLRLTGVVRDRSARAVPDARLAVQLVEPMVTGQPMVLYDESDGKGRFRFDGLPDGPAQVDVTADGCVDLRLTAEAGTEGLAITVWSRPELRGRVRLEPEEPTPADVKVWILGAPGAGRPTARLEPDGSFRVAVWGGRIDLAGPSNQLPAGTDRQLQVVTQVAGWAPAPARTVTVLPGEVTDLGELARPPGRKVHGRVTGPDGQAVSAGVWLAFLDDRVQLYAKAGKNGSFQVEHAPPWEGVLGVDAGPDLPFVTTFLPAATDAPIAVRLGRGGRVRGRVTDLTGRPVDDATVLLAQPLTKGTGHRYLGMSSDATTGEDGRFLTRALPPGVYRLSVTANDDYPGPEIVVREGETATADVRLPVAIRP